jgi:hypothetical protein
MSTLFYVVLSSAGRGCAIGLFPAQRILPKCLKGFIVVEVTSESEQTRRPIREMYNFIHVMVFWVLTLRSDVVGYQRFGRPC